MNNLIKVSKQLAYLLRHSDLPDRNGWVAVDVRSMAAEDRKFYRSQSGVWLVESVPHEYLKVCSYE